VGVLYVLTLKDKRPIETQTIFA